MTEMFIHVGLPKTGTTWIQNEIFRKLDVQYIDYLYLYSYIKPDQKTIISMESLSGVPDLHPYETRKQVAHRLHQLFPRASILLGIRDKEQWIQSGYNEYVKGGGTHNYFVWRTMLFDDRYLRFDEYHVLLKKLFPQVFLYTMQELQDNIHTFAVRLCRFLDEPVPNYNPKKRNPSMKPWQIELQRQFNKLCKSEVHPNGILPYTIGNLERTVVRMLNHDL